jgi:hypothetical protein
MVCLRNICINTLHEGDNDDDDDGNNNNNNNYSTVNAGAGDIGTISCNDRIAATVYSLGTWFV